MVAACTESMIGLSIIELNERVLKLMDLICWGWGWGWSWRGMVGVDERGVFAYSYHAKLL